MRNFLENRIIKEDMQNIYNNSDNWSWLKGKTFFISGAYGMLASYCVFFLIYINETYPEYDIKIIGQGRNSSKMYERFGEYVDRAYFIETNQDICQNIQIESDVDYIIHAASLASPQYYAVNPVGTLLPNSIGTYHLLELARLKNTDGFLFFSSGDVYGDLPDNGKSHTEDEPGCLDPMSLRSCYGESKRMGETMCRAWSEQYDVNAKSVRIAHTYGPTLDLWHDERLFAEFVKNVVDNQDIIMKSDGSAVRMFCYISDAADAFFRILKEGKKGQAYNMCNADGQISVRELAVMLTGLFPEKGIKLVEQEREQNSVYMESPVKTTPVFNTDKLRGLGWSPKVGIEDGFRRTILSFS